jgi:superfamily II DNA or RNA helicase
MKPRVVIRKYLNVIDITADGKRPLGAAEYAIVTPRMEFNRVTHLFGRDVREDKSTGERIRQEVDHQRLYRYDEKGRLMCGAGYIDTVTAAMKSAGFRVELVDIGPPRDPKVFTPDWSRLRGHPEFRLRKHDRERFAERIADGGRIAPTDHKGVALARRVLQRDIIRAVVERMDRGLNGVVQVPPGVGKSYMFAEYMLAFPHAKIDITAPDIANSFKTWRHLTKYSGMVGLIGGGERHYGRCNVYVGPSLHHSKGDADLFLVDEAHKYMGDHLSEQLAVCTASPLSYAFTATPKGRRDGTDARLEGLFGPVIYKMSWPEAERYGLVVPIEVEWIDISLDHNPISDLSERDQEDINKKKRRGLWRNEARNKRIAARALQVPESEQVLIMVEKIEHAIALRRFLPGFELCYGQHDVEKFLRYEKDGDIEKGFAPMTLQRREDMRLDFESGALRRVIATDVWSTGVSFDRLAVLIRADGRSSPILDEQIPGRVSRTHPDKPAGLLIDCRDLFDRGLHQNAMARARNYREKGWRQIADPLGNAAGGKL